MPPRPIRHQFAEAEGAWTSYRRSHEGRLPSLWVDVPKRLRMVAFTLEHSAERVAAAATALAAAVSDDEYAAADELTERAEAAVEGFYTCAFQLVYDLRYYDFPSTTRSFDPVGVSRVRNLLIVHTHRGLRQGSLPPSWSFAMGGDGDARLSFAFRTNENSPRWVDAGTFANADDYVSDFVLTFGGPPT